jgi:arsenate reductase
LTTGHCLCGQAQFHTLAQPRFVAHCHCESCRRQTGSIPASFVGFSEGEVAFTGSVQEFESSPDIFRAFCPTCGSALYYRPAQDKEIHLYLGAFDHPEQFTAERHVFYNEHIAGYELLDNLPRFGDSGLQPIAWGSAATTNILFLCTGNSARSILAEAIANRRSTKGVRAYSAGSRPTGKVHPQALATLEAQGFATEHLRSKSWEEFVSSQAPEIHWVITLCDAAAAEACPVFPGTQQTLHWGLPDPAGRTVSFADTYADLDRRIKEFLARR